MKIFGTKLIASSLIILIFLGVLSSIYTTHFCSKKEQVNFSNCKTSLLGDKTEKCCCSGSIESKCSTEIISKEKSLSNNSANACCRSVSSYFNVPLYQSAKPELKVLIIEKISKNFFIISNNNFSASFFNFYKYKPPLPISQNVPKDINIVFANLLI